MELMSIDIEKSRVACRLSAELPSEPVVALFICSFNGSKVLSFLFRFAHGRAAVVVLFKGWRCAAVDCLPGTFVEAIDGRRGQPSLGLSIAWRFCRAACCPQLFPESHGVVWKYLLVERYIRRK